MQNRTANDVCRDLSKLLKVSHKACSTFLGEVENVASGIRQAYLVDCFCIPSELLNTVHDLLVSASGAEDVFLLHEAYSEQTFVINRTLLNKGSLPEPLYIDAVDLNIGDEPDYIEAILQHIKRKCTQPVAYLALNEVCPGLSAQQARRRMITITGLLLEYPFIYVIPDTASDRQVDTCLNNVSLVVVSLNWLSKGRARNLLKCSIPKELAMRRPGLETHLEQYRRVFNARAPTDDSIGWSTEHTRLDRVVL